MAEIIKNKPVDSVGYIVQGTLDTVTGRVSFAIQDSDTGRLVDTGSADSLVARYQRLASQNPELSNEFNEVARAINEVNNSLLQDRSALNTSSSAADKTLSEQSAGPTQPAYQTQTDRGVGTRPDTSSSSTALTTPTAGNGAVDQGLDGATRTLEQSQAVDQFLGPSEFADAGEIPGVTTFGSSLATDPGVATPLLNQRSSVVKTAPGTGVDDDAADLGTVTVTGNANTSINAASAGVADDLIQPRDNVLDRFSHSTYSASVYLLSPEQYVEFTRTGKRNVGGYNLLFQSGGAPINTKGPQGTAQGVQDGRNPFFTEDFYIESIRLENSLFGKNTRAAHSVSAMKFTVVEPSNITLIDRIYQAVQDIKPKGATGAINYAAATYLMVIRFYGYDQNGKIMPVGAADERTGLSDPNAVIEKFIPFKIAYINWRVASELVKYEFDCVPIGQIVAGGTRRGTIPADVELSGATVEAMLVGEVQYSNASPPNSNPGASTTSNAATDPGEIPGVTVADRNQTDPGYVPPAPPKANAAKSKNYLRQGLIKAMNDIQQKRLDKGEIDVKDVYELKFANGAESIRDAVVTKPGKRTSKDYTATGASVSKGNTQGLSPDKQKMDTTARNLAITAGMQLLQVIDIIIRNSSYITDQAIVKFDEDGNTLPNPNAKTHGMKWFNILMCATPLEYDSKRNDYAYHITYVIVPYEVVAFNSEYFPLPRWKGLHKSYKWWFTGENTSVLDYQATFNSLYNITVTGGIPGDNQVAQLRRTQITSMRDIPFIQQQARSTESDAGADGKANELSANAAEYLYTPSDNQEAQIKIVGDPAWIQQGSLASCINPAAISYDGFEKDGTINFDVNDIMFEIAWQRPEDYDLSTGLADPYGRTSKISGDRQPIQSVIYRAKKVVSDFREGRFEQTIEGSLYPFPIPSGANKAVAVSTPASPNTDRDTNLPTDSTGRVTRTGQSQAALLDTLGSGLRPDTAGLGFNPGKAADVFTAVIPESGQNLLNSLPAGAPTSGSADLRTAVGSTARLIGSSLADTAGITTNNPQPIVRET